ncbi:MAG: hypothetical protein PHU62_07510 [Bacteroidales bacterium]|jgi:hypothetical protein|nr:hypothetical protein [Bacteroidales bacterium]MDD2205024.1 hypothetical protein [Bacteroidales bacterium]MDD3152248.1 hypothetical protein [Bacteroidales bacterium]MDD3914502.1 hypothetical protein [Bacteroidales bacterium]MDD4634399.1 hypothetical protein [Bacteroidales bacterium]
MSKNTIRLFLFVMLSVTFILKAETQEVNTADVSHKSSRNLQIKSVKNGNQNVDAVSGATIKTQVAEQDTAQKVQKRTIDKIKKGLTVGGYGEAVMSRMFYSSNYKRYTNAELYKDAKGYGQFDIPHVVFFIGYDFGNGWSMNAEVEFEHGGTESAVEIEEEETGEYESEIERGGEVAIEQFWIQKSFNNMFNIRAGHIVVPIGLTNQHHLPTEYFTVYRPEGESTILPCTWHETGISIWGKNDKLRYEAQFIAGLDADRFGSQNWIQGGAGSPYEFKLATCYAGVLRIDNYMVNGLRIGVSGYAGTSASNSMKPDAYSGFKGLVAIGTVDFEYNKHNFIMRGNFDYGHLTDSKKITIANINSRADSPSPKTAVASDAMCGGVEAGYDFFSISEKLKEKNQKMFLFCRYDYYDSMFNTENGIIDNECWGRHRIAGGINYKPMDEIVIKAEYSNSIFKSQYNNEAAFSIGIAYSGMFDTNN